MLAVQQAPRMGSTQPESDPLLPFGYSVDPGQEPFFDAPDPAPGAPLLSETDSKFLSSFFEDMTANQYNMPSFGEGLNFSDAWLDLPPQFMGTATSFGPQSAPLDPPIDQSYATSASSSHNDRNFDLQRMMSSSHLMLPPPPPSHTQPYHQQHSDDVLNAAATLLQNGPASRAGAPKTADASPTRRPVGYPVGHLRHQPLDEFKADNRRSSVDVDNDNTNTFAEWIWGPKGRTSQRKVPVGDFQWGSDSNFGLSQGYTPEANKNSVEAIHQSQLKCLECLGVNNKSAADTRSSSPPNGRGAVESRDNSIYVKKEDDTNAPPRKRRKSENVREAVDDDDENDDEASSSKSGKKRKPKNTERSATSPPADTVANGRRRKSTTNATKPPRENLTEEQKRENHIRSEQKRRTLIKEGFDDLGELVPGLKGGGFSKSTTLAMAAEWLEDLVRGNKALSAQLAALDSK
ncbi:hypothetical protein CDD83_10727 [Cordyceps sp. RAO-2017]|nr:hypothetical protein CDD83_10727 [Cordyceps sp. RAO-2017]